MVTQCKMNLNKQRSQTKSSKMSINSNSNTKITCKVRFHTISCTHRNIICTTNTTHKWWCRRLKTICNISKSSHRTEILNSINNSNNNKSLINSPKEVLQTSHLQIHISTTIMHTNTNNINNSINNNSSHNSKLFNKELSLSSSKHFRKSKN